MCTSTKWMILVRYNYIIIVKEKKTLIVEKLINTTIIKTRIEW